MLFYSFFKSLVGKDVVVELKNDLRQVFGLHDVTGPTKTCPGLPEAARDLPGAARALPGALSGALSEGYETGFLNIKLTDISVTDPDKYPHMLSVKTCFIRGSVVRYVQLPADECDTQLLQDAARKEAAQNKQR
nr:hypothetical protein BaRGS_003398 [Batillaria attramentaria]